MPGAINAAKHCGLFLAPLLLASFCRADTADSLNRQAAELEQQGRYREGEAQYRRALNACRQDGCAFLGAILTNLGSLFHATARYQEAESVLRQAVETGSAEGQDPASLPTALVNLAAVYRAEGRYAEAGPLYERALQLRESDPATAASEVPRLLTHMAALEQDMGNLPRAEELIRRALAAFTVDESTEDAAGLANRGDALVTLGAILVAEGKPAEAEEAERRALLLYRTHFGETGSPGSDYAAALSGLANVLVARGRPQDAEPLLRDAVAIWQKRLGPDHPNVASGLMNLATVLQVRRRYEEAGALMDRSLRMDVRNLPADHPRIAVDLNNVAGLLLVRKRYRDAEQVLLRAARILERRSAGSDPGDPHLGQILANLGDVYRLEKRLPESRKSFARGIRILIAAWGPLDPRLLTWLNDYASVLRASEEYTEAGKLEMQATRIRVTEARRRAG